ncbi:MAG: hypothetical protein QM796_09095 [Chthoniobacteraceae bacterium]
MIVVETSTSVVAFDEALHDLLQFVLVHLAVADFHLRAGHQRANAAGDALDALDAVVQEIDLALAREFALDRVADDPLVVAADEGLGGNAIRAAASRSCSCPARP